MNSTRYRLLATLILLLGCLHVLVQSAPFEDAYITYRYAEHFAHGQGLSYNAGERVEAACGGGIGRTGTALGCWLVGQGLSGSDALALIARNLCNLPTVSHCCQPPGAML